MRKVLAPETFKDYEQEVEAAYHINPSWRWGQTYYNVLECHRPELAKQIRNTNLDPFLFHYASHDFLTWVAEAW